MRRWLFGWGFRLLRARLLFSEHIDNSSNRSQCCWTNAIRSHGSHYERGFGAGDGIRPIQRHRGLRQCNQ